MADATDVRGEPFHRKAIILEEKRLGTERSGFSKKYLDAMCTDFFGENHRPGKGLPIYIITRVFLRLRVADSIKNIRKIGDSYYAAEQLGAEMCPNK